MYTQKLAIEALDLNRLGLENKFLEKKIGLNFWFPTSFKLYKILPTKSGGM